MRASIRQVAERAGVSRTTVSNLLLGRDGRASRETRERVLRAAEELNYIPVPQPVTQTRRGKTNIIGLVFGDITSYDDWGMPAYRGLCEVAAEHGYDLLTLLRSGPQWTADQERRFLDRRTDGFVFVSPGGNCKSMEVLARHEIPVVTCSINEMVAGVPGAGADDRDFMEQAVAYLAERGHRRIAHCSGPPDRDYFRYRRLGYQSAMTRLGYSPHVIAMEEPDWETALLEAVEQHGVTAVAAACDHFALRAWGVLKSRGLRVPEDVSIIGVDDVPDAAHRGLTTYSCSAREIGRIAMKGLIELIEGDRYPAERVVVPFQLMERSSVAGPRPAL